MPPYEYECRDCDHAFEALVNGDERATCPKCAGGKLQRLLSLPGRPKAKSAALPRACGGDPSKPPCGSACPRF